MGIRKICIGLAIGAWVSVYAWIQLQIAGALGVESELWPVLMAPGLVGILGGGRTGEKKYYKMMLTGILAGCVFVCLEHAIYPFANMIGVLMLLALIVALIIILGYILPDWFGGATFIAFCASTILTNNIVELTIARIVALLVGTAIFLFVEQLIVKTLSKQRENAA